ncbi:NADPH-dependent FMN reductase [Dokdonella koreensis]|uniref:NADPH-dependent FMN reductase n=1 Tax=Dokdonella koreensis DS-123 TaxID=1300342 RepID=A0A167H6T7_9GAMM|nr:NADPH-dependent FMN reductase [Dokdonella koreensis]ANB19212.1 NADPH-dependent FMN reductase [Dokdonella koreensis DS-123]
MSTITVAVFVGSLRKESINRRLAKAIEKLAPSSLAFEPVEIGDLPLYTQEFDGSYPSQGQRLKDQVKAADALLFVTPEYNRSIPGVLKNAIDIGSRPWGTNSFAGKRAAVIGASPGAIGSALAQQHLRNVLSYLDVDTLPQPEVFVQFKEGLVEADGTITSDGTRTFLQGFVDRFAAWVGATR